jgi:hypothetical protein
VFDTNEAAVLNDRSHGPDPRSSGFHGWIDWVRRIRYSPTSEVALKTSTVRA